MLQRQGGIFVNQILLSDAGSQKRRPGLSHHFYTCHAPLSHDFTCHTWHTNLRSSHPQCLHAHWGFPLAKWLTWCHVFPQLKTCRHCAGYLTLLSGICCTWNGDVNFCRTHWAPRTAASKLKMKIFFTSQLLRSKKKKMEVFLPPHFADCPWQNCTGWLSLRTAGRKTSCRANPGSPPMVHDVLGKSQQYDFFSLNLRNKLRCVASVAWPLVLST